MSDDKKKEPLSIAEVIWAAARWLAERELLLRLGMVAFFLIIGGGAVVYAQDAGVKYVAPLREELAAQREENKKVHAQQALEREQDRADLATTKMQSAEAMLNVRLIVERLNMKPIILAPEPATDGGR